MCDACADVLEDAALELAEQVLLADDTGFSGARRRLTDAERRARTRFGDLDRLETAGIEAAALAVAPVFTAAVDAVLDAVAAVQALEPAGWTPLADALAAAGAQLAPSDTAGEQVVYVVSDGEETCGGDPVAEARALHDGDIRAGLGEVVRGGRADDAAACNDDFHGILDG